MKAPMKGQSGKDTDCSTALQSFDVSSSNLAASTLRGNYVSALDRKYKGGRPTPKAGNTPISKVTQSNVRKNGVPEAKSNILTAR